MSSLFASKGLLPSLKRRTRSNSKPEPASRKAKRKAKPLHILPGLSEEEEGRRSCSSTPSLDLDMSSPSTGHSSTFGGWACKRSPDEWKLDPRRVGQTRVRELLPYIDYFPDTIASPPPRPAPAPPLYQGHDRSDESYLDEISLQLSSLGISLEFPSPPSDATPSPTRRRNRSPAPSVSSSATSSTSTSGSSSRSRRAHVTPPTSDDESHEYHLLRAPICKSRRASISYAAFAASMPNLHISAQEEDTDEECDSDAEWYANDISDVVTLSSPLPPSFPKAFSSDPRARPDSMMPLARLPSHSGTAPQSSSEPITQPDCTLPQRKETFLVLDGPASPPPITVTRCSISTMERETDELLAELASAALGSGFAGTGLGASHGRPVSSIPPTPSSAYVVRPLSGRPPPRMSIPADVSDLTEEALYAPGMSLGLRIDPIAANAASQVAWPLTPPNASLCSYPGAITDALPTTPNSASSCDYEMDLDLDMSILEQCTPDEFARPPSERTLRSRWSSSTIGSQFERDSQSASWKTRFGLSPTKRSRHRSGSLQQTTAHRRSLEQMLKRKDSKASVTSDGGEHTPKGKAGPVDRFMRS
ncbi:hypothetical protein WOLCODRAFT_165310 [Wolfiporia cocos MD-104 SS10]|uniref:Uncharacterized protein n=1 Tax=Wolfiporia cocos (strain MD-104) TaxID=742152 RepID=A0A2H3K0H1_WOLCO|nr:hypothetical protein WOLCODRAFT_165310 [Wolfiporia cocos MD-104 SS10]